MPSLVCQSTLGSKRETQAKNPHEGIVGAQGMKVQAGHIVIQEGGSLPGSVPQGEATRMDVGLPRRHLRLSLQILKRVLPSS